MGGGGGAEPAWHGVVPVLVGCGVSCPWVRKGNAVWYGGAELRGGLPDGGGRAPSPGLVGSVVAPGWSSGGVGQPYAVPWSSFWRLSVRGWCAVVVVWGLGPIGAGCEGSECRNQGCVVAGCFGVSANY